MILLKFDTFYRRIIKNNNFLINSIWNKKNIIVISLLIGISLGFLFENPNKLINITNQNNQSFNLILFIEIFFNNLIVGLLLSIGGYFSYGILTIFILIWNGVILGSLFKLCNNVDVTFLESLKYFIFHGTFELYSFFLFSLIGFKGWKFYNRLFYNELFLIEIKLSDFLIPIILLLIAAAIEVCLISYI